MSTKSAALHQRLQLSEEMLAVNQKMRLVHQQLHDLHLIKGLNTLERDHSAAHAKYLRRTVVEMCTSLVRGSQHIRDTMKSVEEHCLVVLKNLETVTEYFATLHRNLTIGQPQEMLDEIEKKTELYIKEVHFRDLRKEQDVKDVKEKNKAPN